VRNILHIRELSPIFGDRLIGQAGGGLTVGRFGDGL
jgi:hypothetical protein